MNRSNPEGRRRGDVRRRQGLGAFRARVDDLPVGLYGPLLIRVDGEKGELVVEELPALETDSELFEDLVQFINRNGGTQNFAGFRRVPSGHLAVTIEVQEQPGDSAANRHQEINLVSSLFSAVVRGISIPGCVSDEEIRGRSKTCTVKAVLRPNNPADVWTHEGFDGGASLVVTSDGTTPREEMSESKGDKPSEGQRDYGINYERSVARRHAFHQELADGLQGVLNEKVKSLPQDSYAEKQALSGWINRQLRNLGLAIRCPKTGLPGNLVADLKGAESEVSRFRLEVRGEDGKRRRTISWKTLPELVLMEDEPREEPLIKWAERVKEMKGNRGSASRGRKK